MMDDDTENKVPRGASALLGLFSLSPKDKNGRQTENLSRGGESNTSILQPLIDADRERLASEKAPLEKRPQENTQTEEVSGSSSSTGRSRSQGKNRITFLDGEGHLEPSPQPLRASIEPQETSLLQGLFEPKDETLTPCGSSLPILISTTERSPYSFDEKEDSEISADDEPPSLKERLSEFRQKHLTCSNLLGAAVFLLYHVVFCLSMGSTVRRPHSSTSILGIMTKSVAMGVMFASPVYILSLSPEIPAVYPCVDLFLAPFMSHLGETVDEQLYTDGITDTDIFLASFAMVSGIGLMTTSLMVLLASKFKLANLGSYLPYPVLCGFFGAVGVSMWSLAFTVDTGGQRFGQVLMAGDWKVLGTSLLHHSPSFFIAVVMKWLGNKNPLSVSSLVLLTVAVVYMIMAISGTSRSEAMHTGWFWSPEELAAPKANGRLGLDTWLPPLPFGFLNSWRLGYVHWGAVVAGLKETFTLAFLYMLRCSLQGTALKKNVPNLRRMDRQQGDEEKNQMPLANAQTDYVHLDEDLDLETAHTRATHVGQQQVKYVHANPANVTASRVLAQYSYSLTVSSLLGIFPVTPTIAAAPTMYRLHAEGVAPQLGSLFLLGLIYLTDFKFVLFVPKAAFSCLLVLAALDMFHTWLLQSYMKTKEKIEWLVAPLIIVFGSIVGMLNAVFLGITLSTFIFVAAFFRSGIVKFIASGLTVRSTIERSIDSASWLDENGDLIQIMVLQNYLFFGNSASILAYISSMFEEVENEAAMEDEIPPLPKYIILDLTLVTGMDTSTVDVFQEMKELCSRYECKLFLAGVSSSLRGTLSQGGFKPEHGHRSLRKIRFFIDLDTALGTAEDNLLYQEGGLWLPDDAAETKDDHTIMMNESGFLRALRKIDEQHGENLAMDLSGFEDYSKCIRLEPRQFLYESDGGVVPESERGLLFIESGVVKIERDKTFTTTRTTRGNGHPVDARGLCSNFSLNGMKARLGTIGRQSALLRGSRAGALFGDTRIRLARIGPGWVIGAEGGSVGRVLHTAMAVTKCKLHLVSFSKLQEIERRDPALVLSLYKLLSHLAERRQEITVGQLVTLHSILTSPPQRKPVGRLRNVASHQSFFD